jgi:hypothetical protein
MVGRVEGLTDAGVHRVALRVSPRLAGANPRLVKIAPRWAGASRTLKRLQPRALLVEEKRPESKARLHAVLDELGYLPTSEVLDHNAVFRPGIR